MKEQRLTHRPLFTLLARVSMLATVAVAAVTVALAASAGAAGTSSGAGLSESQAQKVGTDAYVYGIALMEFVRQARIQTSVTVPNALSDAPLNQLGNARQLADVKHQVFVQPNLDTLYTMGHLNLSQGPLVLHVPAVPHHRYYSFEFLDPYTNVFHYVGTRATGDRSGNYAITGPRWHGHLPRGLHRIRSAFQLAWIVGRTAVYGPHDLSNVHRTQNGYRLIPLKQYERHGLRWHPRRPRRIVKKHRSVPVPTGLSFFDQLGTALAADPPPKRDAAILRELRTVGVGPGLHPSQENLSAAVRAGLIAAAKNGMTDIYALRLSLAGKSIGVHNGWYVPSSDTGLYGTDYDLRAVVAVNGLAANRPVEAMYIVGAADQQHALLNGSHDYVIHFAAGHLPPARYFWSLTMYDESFFLVPNRLNRYALGNRSPSLKRNRDGSLDIYLQRTAPAGHRGNWLPAPAGQFEVTLRLYGPGKSALKGTYVYPHITRTS
jgi:hypothetical protein